MNKTNIEKENKYLLKYFVIYLDIIIYVRLLFLEVPKMWIIFKNDPKMV